MMKIVMTISQLVCLCFLVVAYNNFSTNLPVAVKIEKNVIIKEIKQDLMALNAPTKKIPELTNAVYIAHQSTGLNPKLITSLMYTESNFNNNALGPTNKTKTRYKGLMQTPTATWFSDVDTLHGARILVEKLEISNYNLRKALALYIGGNSPTAYRQADRVLRIYNQL
jgi:hypothetical protein